MSTTTSTTAKVTKLTNVVTGDEVVWTNDRRSGATYYRKVRVTAHTATRFTTEDGMVWNRNTGEEWGSKSTHRRPSIVMNAVGNYWPYPLLTWAEADEQAARELEERDRSRLQREIARWFDGNYGTLSLDQLDRIARIIAEGRHDSADFYKERNFSDLSDYMRRATPATE